MIERAQRMPGSAKGEDATAFERKCKRASEGSTPANASSSDPQLRDDGVSQSSRTASHFPCPFPRSGPTPPAMTGHHLTSSTYSSIYGQPSALDPAITGRAGRRPVLFFQFTVTHPLATGAPLEIPVWKSSRFPFLSIDIPIGGGESGSISISPEGHQC